MENEIFDEIEEEVRQDKVIKFMKKYKKSLLSAILLIAVAILFIATYISNKKQESELYTAKLVSLFFNIDAGNDVDREIDYIIKNAPKQISDLAKLVKNSDSKDAVTEMFRIYSDDKVDIMLKYAAFLGYAFRKLDDDSFEKKDILVELDKILMNKNIPFMLVFLELKGYVLMKLSDYAGALAVFDELLRSDSVTEIMKNRVNFVIDYIKSIGN